MCRFSSFPKYVKGGQFWLKDFLITLDEATEQSENFRHFYMLLAGNSAKFGKTG